MAQARYPSGLALQKAWENQIVRGALNPRLLHRNLTTFQKVAIANSAIIVVGAVIGPVVTINSARSRLPFLLGLLAIGLVAILVANFLILRLAFKPMRELESTMSSVRPGIEEPRVHADFADPDLRRIATVFNSMLDRLEHERHLNSQRVLQAQERERQRVARELHDQTGQALTHEIIALDLLLERTGDPDARNQLQAVKRTLEETLEEVHRMSQDLRPSVLDDLGLVPALRTLAKQPSGAHISLHVDGLRDRLPPPIETALYRIAQEALTNANKYARATNVNIDLRCLDGHVQLLVRDDGVGFDPDSIPEKEEPGRAGLGIFGMRERAALLRGTLDIHSGPQRGTEVVAQLPLEDRHATAS
jgi:two-component system sensor histidine kinase UhpB